MSNTDDLQRKLLNTFQAESDEHLQNLNGVLLQIERQPEPATRQQLLQEAFRTAHNLKGAARAVSLTEIESIAHAMESVLQQARDMNLELSPTTCDVMYDALDTIQQLVGGQSLEIETLISSLQAVHDGVTTSAQPEADSQHEAQPSSQPTPVVTGEDTIRVTVSKLDDLMAQAGELVVSDISAQQRMMDMRALRDEVMKWPKTWRELKTIFGRLNGGDAGRHLVDMLMDHHEYMQALTRQVNALEQMVSRDTANLNVNINRLRDEVRRVRMIPFQTVVPGLQRTVRDVARSEKKQVNLVVEGGEVELDKQILETLKDPLMHLLRNAVNHGIESEQERAAAGKSAEGQVIIRVAQRGSEVHIAVQDDGRGFDLEGLRWQSSSSSPFEPDAASDDIIALAFQPGVTTVREVNEFAGRGVGLDVVRQRVETLQGRIKVDNRPQEGVIIELIVPVSLTMSRGLLVRVGNERYVLPLMAVDKIEDATAIFSVEGQAMIQVDNEPVPLTSLADLLERPRVEHRNGSASYTVILSVAEQRLAVLVDEVDAEQELAVKPLGMPLRRVRNVEGAALLGTGEPVIVLNAADLMKSARHVPFSPVFSFNGSQTNGAGPHAHILVVDDSITTRTLEKNILETAGYTVTTAIDGLEALKQLDNTPVDLVVADVQMPHLDGIALVRQLRDSSEYGTLPIILVTSLESREDREQGMMAGADAYIVKRGFDQAELLSTIEGLL